VREDEEADESKLDLHHCYQMKVIVNSNMLTMKMVKMTHEG
jgi:hypothetical protein